MSQHEPEAASVAPEARGGDLIIPLLACALTGYFFLSTLDLVWEAKATGLVIGLVLLAMCVAQFTKVGIAVVTGRANLSLGDLIRNDAFNRQRLWLAIMVALYIATIHWVGASVGLFFLLIGSMRLLGVTSWRTLVIVAFVTAVIVHLCLITLLDGSLPRGIIVNTIASAMSGA